MLGETDGAGSLLKDYIYFAGRRLVAVWGNTGYFYRGDPIGSSRIVTWSTGAPCSDSDFTPFGSEIVHLSSCSQNYKFAAMERDAETGNDHTQFRQYASNFGRWLSPDPAGKKAVKLDDPQTWNLYSYVRDNPLTLTDPTGLDALWVVDRQTGEVTLVIPVHFTGNGATQENIARIVERDNTLDRRGSQVKIKVVSTDQPINGVINTMDLSPGPQEQYGQIGEGVNRVGGNQGHINTDNADAAGAASHDTLHFAGIRDQYIEGPRDAQGNRTSRPTPGYDNSNIMTSRAGTKIKPEQVQEAKTNRTTKKCTSNNRTITCQ